VIVDNSDVSRWFGEYLDAFAACGRGEHDTASLLAYYGVPLLLTTDDGCFALTSDDQVAAAAQQQVDGMRAADYDHSEVLHFEVEVTILNATSALYRGTFSRQRATVGRSADLPRPIWWPTGRLVAALQRSRFIVPDASPGCCA
jgi:hypothetical protein